MHKKTIEIGTRSELRLAAARRARATARAASARGPARRAGVQLLDARADESIDRLGVCTFTVTSRDHRLVAAALASEHAIAVRSGAFCAHPLVAHLLDLSPGR